MVQPRGVDAAQFSVSTHTHTHTHTCFLLSTYTHAGDEGRRISHFCSPVAIPFAVTAFH